MFAPFRGILYRPEVVGDVAGVTAPPYDAIDEEGRVELARRSPYNVVRLLLPSGGENRFRRAGQLLDEWMAAGVLSADDEERFYLYEMRFVDERGREHSARGVLGALALHPLGRGIVGHEETMSHTREDRLAVLAATRANLDPIVVLSGADDLGALLRPVGKPRIDVEVAGRRHLLYDLVDPEHVAAVSAQIGSHSIAIADGHHRYLTALAYRHDRNASDGPGPWDAILAFAAPARGSGLAIGPFHRTFPHVEVSTEALATVFDVRPAEPSVPARPGDLALAWAGGPCRLLRAHPEALEALPGPLQGASAAIARYLLYPLLGLAEDRAGYQPSVERAMAWLEHHPQGAVVLTAPVPEPAIAAAIEAGITFPQKTTYFTPKPRAGLVLRGFAL